MNIKLSQLFSSRARAEILETLYYASSGLGLRKIADICNLHPHSAEVALKQMHRERLVQKQKKGQQVIYKLTKKPDISQFLKDIFSTVERNKIRQGAASVKNEGIAILKFITSSQQMIDHARRSYHGSK